MQEHERLDEIEKAIGGMMREKAAQSASPPFSRVAGRIAAGQPSESFEAFFAEDIPAAAGGIAARRSGKGQRKLKIFAGAAAAALVFFIAGGVLLGAILGGGGLGAKYASEAADCAAYEEEGDTMENGAAAVCEDADEQCVSDSDLTDSDEPDSSG